MPGVPSGRGCDACRRQKKKCDQVTPRCSRCKRLQIPCLGAGRQRYIFKGARTVPQDSASQSSGDGSSPSVLFAPCRIVTVSNSETTRLASQLIDKIRPGLDVRFDLAWSYGDFLQDVPKRLGINQALDAATDVLVAAHARFRTGCLAPTSDILRKHGHALTVLRRYLDDPVDAYKPETLCAVQILLICQTFIGGTTSPITGHSQGAAQLIRARQRCKSDDVFEKKVIATLRGPVLFEGLYNEKITLTQQEWRDLVEHEFDGITPDGQMMRSLAQMPYLMERGRVARSRGPSGHQELTFLQQDMAARCMAFKPILTSLYERLKTAEAQLHLNGTSPSASGTRLLCAHYERIYCIALAIGIVLNCVFSGLGCDDIAVQNDSQDFAERILQLNANAQRYRPIGASYMSLGLTAAWVGASEQSTKDTARLLLTDYAQDFGGSITFVALEHLEWMSRRLHLVC